MKEKLFLVFFWSVIIFILLILTCGVGMQIFGTKPKQSWMGGYTPEQDTYMCIRGHLGQMAEADHVTSWSADLYQAVAEECERLFLEPKK